MDHDVLLERPPLAVSSNSPATLILNRQSINSDELTAQELGILVYICSIVTDSGKRPADLHIDPQVVIERFSEDEPLTILLALRELSKKGYFMQEDSLTLEILLHQQENHLAPVH